MTEPLPLDRSRPLQGRDLRHAALVVLDRSGAASIGEILGAFDAGGFAVAGEHPNKALADGLRHEVKRGRLRRVGWGRYAIARLAKTTARRVRLRWNLAVGHRPNGDEQVGSPPNDAVVVGVIPVDPAAAERCRAVMSRWHYLRQWRPPREGEPRTRGGRRGLGLSYVTVVNL